MGLKHQSIVDLLEGLELPRRGWVVVDHWEGDLHAVGVAAVGQPDRLVYVSTFEREPGRYAYEMELPARQSGAFYVPAGSGSDVSFSDLLQVMEVHLGPSTGST